VALLKKNYFTLFRRNIRAAENLQYTSKLFFYSDTIRMTHYPVHYKEEVCFSMCL